MCVFSIARLCALTQLGDVSSLSSAQLGKALARGMSTLVADGGAVAGGGGEGSDGGVAARL